MPTKSLCPICKKPTVHQFRPFCSRACGDRDLINWADERYAVPARPDDDEEDRPEFEG